MLFSMMDRASDNRNLVSTINAALEGITDRGRPEINSLQGLVVRDSIECE